MRSAQAGFTAVEVLVTLAIAALLVGGAYQAYNIVVRNTEQATQRSTASNLAYQTLRSEAAKLTTTCTTNTVNHSIAAAVILPTPRSMQTVVTCPYGTGANKLKLVSTTLTYGGAEVKHALVVE